MSATDSPEETFFDQTIVQVLTAAIETSINTALEYDPSSRQKIAELIDILAIKITIPQLCIYLRGQENGIAVLSYNEAPVVTQLTGSPLALLNLLKQPSNLANSGVSLVGSTALLQQWQGILQRLDIDWEDAISRVLGDIAGPLTASNIKDCGHWMQQQLTEQGRLIAEYLPEELKLTPSKPEAEQFFDKVDSLALTVDRIAARLKALEDTVSAEKYRHNNQNENESAS